MIGSQDDRGLSATGAASVWQIAYEIFIRLTLCAFALTKTWVFDPTMSPAVIKISQAIGQTEAAPVAAKPRSSCDPIKRRNIPRADRS